jgi:hypothetical protein
LPPPKSNLKDVCECDKKKQSIATVTAINLVLNSSGLPFAF